jgi:hypothetical protein
VVEPTGFYADVVADALSLPRCATREEAYSVMEALRAGAERVLDMEREDLQVLVVGHPGTDEVDALLYDAMPGGSGLLDQLCARFSEVVAVALLLVTDCPSQCARSCIDCLNTFRNAFFQKHLNRELAAERLRTWGDQLQSGHDIPPKVAAAPTPTADMPVNDAEAALCDMLHRAGFPDAQWHAQIPLGKPLGSTSPDAFYPGEDEGEPGTCVYLDGLSAQIHGNPSQMARDRAIRDELRSLGYEVVEIAASDLADRGAMARHLFRLGRILLGKDEARAIRDNPTWFAEASPAGAT